MNERPELSDPLNILHDDIEHTNCRIGVALEAIGAAMAATFQRFAVAMRHIGEAFSDPLTVGMAFALLTLDRHRVLLRPGCTDAKRFDNGNAVGVTFRLRAPFRWLPPLRRWLQRRLTLEVLRNFPIRLRGSVCVWADGGPIDTTPRPPFHYNCRCAIAPAPTEGEHDGEENGH